MAPFSSSIDFKGFEIWHHEGRRMRFGAFMNGPDYVQWHGIYEQLIDMGIFAGVILLFQAYSYPDRGLSLLLGTTLFLSFVVGLLGFAFHLSTDLAGRGNFQWSRVFYQAPGLTPLLFKINDNKWPHSF